MTKWLCWFGHKWVKVEGLLPQWVMGACFLQYRCRRCGKEGLFRDGWFDPPAFIPKKKNSRGDA